MRKTYIIKRLDEKCKRSCGIWDDIPVAYIDNFRWDENGYRPVTEVKLFYSESHFHILFKVYEQEPRVTYYNMNDPVYKDSCVEFFFNPTPGPDKRYLNFEMNAAGTLLLSIGEDRNHRSRVNDLDPGIFKIKTFNGTTLEKAETSFWTLEYSIPFDFINKYFKEFYPESGRRIAANFYKCGDDTKLPHFGCWNPINCPSPDFHRPEFFGMLLLE